MGHEVFISHSAKDKPIADAVCAALETHGIGCWIAPRDILPGVDWGEAIMNGITGSKVMLLVFTRNSNESSQVKKEVDRAMDKGVVVIPLRIDDVPMNKTLEFHLGKSHCMDAMTPPFEKHLQVLVSRLKTLLEAGGKPPIPAPAAASVRDAQAPLPAPPRPMFSPDVAAQPMTAAPRRRRSPLLIAGMASILLIALATAFAFRGKLRQTLSGGATHGDAGQPDANTITVTTAQEFVDAIKPNRVIRLSPGEYLLTDVKVQHMDFVRWDRNFDGYSLTIRDVKNLSVVGLGEKSVQLIVRPRYVFVLNFDNCHGVHLSNLIMGHAPEKGGCDSGVVGATGCSDLSFQKCDLFGCGTEGLTLKNVQKLNFDDSTIRDCSYGIMTVAGCDDLSFSRSHFTGNKQYYGIKINDSKNVNFYDCFVENNEISDALFQATSTSDVVFHRGVIRNNRAAALTDGLDEGEIDGAAMDGNQFTKSQK